MPLRSAHVNRIEVFVVAKKYSRQREAILSELSAVTSHPTALDIYDMVRKRIPNISLGTVYRNLAELSDSGQVLKIATGDGIERFDASTHQHYHFKCLRCDGVSDVDLDAMDGIEKIVAERTGNRVTSHSILFTGVCQKCDKEES